VRGRFRAQSIGDHFEHAFHIVHDVVVPESQDSEVVFAQPSVSHKVSLISGMLAAINFNN